MKQFREEAQKIKSSDALNSIEICKDVFYFIFFFKRGFEDKSKILISIKEMSRQRNGQEFKDNQREIRNSSLSPRKSYNL